MPCKNITTVGFKHRDILATASIAVDKKKILHLSAVIDSPVGEAGDQCAVRSSEVTDRSRCIKV